MVEATNVFVLHNVEPSLVNNDIQLFLRQSFLEIAYRHEINDWPTIEQLDLLCQQSGGLFVHAVATVKFIGNRNNPPESS